MPKIKDFSDANIGCRIPKSMHPAKDMCILPYVVILMLKKAGISVCMGLKVHAP